MTNKKRAILFLSAAVLFFSISFGLELSRSEAETPSISPYLLMKRTIFKSSSETHLSAVLDSDKEITVNESLFIVTDLSSKKIVVSKENAFSVVNDKGLGLSSGVDFGLLPDLAPGKYDAVWRVNGVDSNHAAFQVVGEQDSIPPLRSLTLEVLQYQKEEGQPSSHPLRFVIRYTNQSAKRMDLVGALTVSELILNGKPFRRVGVLWSGNPSLEAGGLWSSLFSLDDYVKQMESGKYFAQIEFAGERSNEISFEYD